jgi:glutamate--cysteine ligase
MAGAEDEQRVTTAQELVADFLQAGKPRHAWRVGAEHEKVGVVLASGAAAPYAGDGGIAAVLAALEGRGWSPVYEGPNLIALQGRGASVTLEPGGQLELSGAPHGDLCALKQELARHHDELAEISSPLGLGWLAIGFRPLGTLEEIPWVPKARYAVMREYLPTRGGHAHDMMKRTATVQANLDYADEADAERKLRAAMSATSLVTALWANSPVVEGQDSGYESYRARVWLDTDADRCGIPAFIFDDAARTGIFSRYTEWALEVPMFFVKREHWGYRPTGGITFRRFMREGFAGERATLGDWQLHLSTLFPENRLKHYLEVRGADAGSLDMVLALPALWKGLLYDDEALSATLALTAHWSLPERLDVRARVPRSGLATPVPGRHGKDTTVLTLARELVAIARAGLGRVAPRELVLLPPVEEVAAAGRAPAARVRELFAQGDPLAAIDQLRLAGPKAVCR